jgi:hypothetical protein
LAALLAEAPERFPLEQNAVTRNLREFEPIPALSSKNWPAIPLT